MIRTPRSLNVKSVTFLQVCIYVSIINFYFIEWLITWKKTLLLILVNCTTCISTPRFLGRILILANTANNVDTNFCLSLPKLQFHNYTLDRDTTCHRRFYLCNDIRGILDTQIHHPIWLRKKKEKQCKCSTSGSLVKSGIRGISFVKNVRKYFAVHDIQRILQFIIHERDTTYSSFAITVIVLI